MRESRNVSRKCPPSGCGLRPSKRMTSAAESVGIRLVLRASSDSNVKLCVARIRDEVKERREEGQRRRTMRLFWLGLFTLIFTASAHAQIDPGLLQAVKALQDGGYVIVFRHGATHADQADTDPLNIANVAKQRQLNDKGRADAKAVGEAFRAAGIPIGKSHSSRFQRAVETARLIGGKEPQTTLDLSEGGLVVSPNENTRRTQALRALAAAAPDPGTNTLIVTHKPNILDAFGKDWFEIREGEASVFKPDGGGKSTLIGRVQIAEWETAKK